MDDDPLIPVFVPPLVVLLAHFERKKGTPLTQEEVLAIRDKGACMMAPQSMAYEVGEKRGYQDIDSKYVWEEWQVIRLQLPQTEEIS